MVSDQYLQKIQDLFLYRFSQPPYFLLLIGLLISFSCVLPFILILRQLIQYWSKYHSQEAFTRWRKLQVLTPYIGTLVGVCIALASALEILGLATFASYLVALLVISVVGFLVWLQIGRILSKNLVRSYLSESKELFPQK
ncbi:MAG: hypothetical protein KME29_15180 [Calothrix sp. FI2-JRJ7]|nr:hypothetical protein [Calothrix sp. FI2-JRJ7]